MKNILVGLIICFVLAGCSGSPGNILPNNKTGVIILPYPKPIDFKQFEVYISTVAEFNPTGWDGSAWTGQPNAPAVWDGTANTLFMVTQNDPIQVTGLTPGVTYYIQVVVIDKTNQRSIPSPEISQVAGDSQRSSTLVVAASDASPASKAGADYVCDGVSDQDTINEAFDAAIAANPGQMVTIKGTEGLYIVDGSILVPSNVTLDVAGTVKIKDGLSSAIAAITNDDQVNGNGNILLKNLTVDGNKSNNPGRTHNGIALINGTNIKVDNVYLKAINYRSLDYRCENGSINNCKVTDATNFNIYLYGSKNVVVSNNQISDSMGASIQVVLSNGVTVSNNVCAKAGGILLDVVGNSNVLGNVCSDNQGYGIYIAGSNNNIISGNNCKANENYNILIDNSSSNNNIQNNICRKDTGDYTSVYGIRISSGDRNIVSNNDCYLGGSTAGISNAGTNTNFGAGNRNNGGGWSTTPS